MMRVPVLELFQVIVRVHVADIPFQFATYRVHLSHTQGHRKGQLRQQVRPTLFQHLSKAAITQTRIRLCIQCGRELHRIEQSSPS